MVFSEDMYSQPDECSLNQPLNENSINQIDGDTTKSNSIQTVRERRASFSSSTTDDSGYGSVAFRIPGFTVVESKTVQHFQSNQEYLLAMIEDLADWFNVLYEVGMSVDTFFEILSDGVLLCRHAHEVHNAGQEYIQLNDGRRDLPMKIGNAVPVIPEKAPLYRASATIGSFLARDNIANFIKWCRAFGIPNSLAFETEDLVTLKNPRSVVLCLLEIARIGAKFGMEVPDIVHLEEEIDAEIEADQAAQQVHNQNENNIDGNYQSFQTPDSTDLHANIDSNVLNNNSRQDDRVKSSSSISTVGLEENDRAYDDNCTDDYYDGDNIDDSSSTTSGGDAGNGLNNSKGGRRRKSRRIVVNHPTPVSQYVRKPLYQKPDRSGPKKDRPQTDMKSLDEMVRDILAMCTCEKTFHMTRKGEGKYLFGDKSTLIFVRILRNHVMVRVGGGWDTLNHFLEKYDSCRQHRQAQRSGCSASRKGSLPFSSANPIETNSNDFHRTGYNMPRSVSAKSQAEIQNGIQSLLQNPPPPKHSKTTSLDPATLLGSLGNKEISPERLLTSPQSAPDFDEFKIKSSLTQTLTSTPSSTPKIPESPTSFAESPLLFEASNKSSNDEENASTPLSTRISSPSNPSVNRIRSNSVAQTPVLSHNGENNNSFNDHQQITSVVNSPRRFSISNASSVTTSSMIRKEDKERKVQSSKSGSPDNTSMRLQRRGSLNIKDKATSDALAHKEQQERIKRFNKLNGKKSDLNASLPARPSSIAGNPIATNKNKQRQTDQTSNIDKTKEFSLVQKERAVRSRTSSTSSTQGIPSSTASTPIKPSNGSSRRASLASTLNEIECNLRDGNLGSVARPNSLQLQNTADVLRHNLDQFAASIKIPNDEDSASSSQTTNANMYRQMQEQLNRMNKPSLKSGRSGSLATTITGTYSPSNASSISSSRKVSANNLNRTAPNISSSVKQSTRDGQKSNVGKTSVVSSDKTKRETPQSISRTPPLKSPLSSARRNPTYSSVGSERRRASVACVGISKDRATPSVKIKSILKPNRKNDGLSKTALGGLTEQLKAGKIASPTKQTFGNKKLSSSNHSLSSQSSSCFTDKSLLQHSNQIQPDFLSQRNDNCIIQPSGASSSYVPLPRCITPCGISRIPVPVSAPGSASTSPKSQRRNRFIAAGQEASNQSHYPSRPRSQSGISTPQRNIVDSESKPAYIKDKNSRILLETRLRSGSMPLEQIDSVVSASKENIDDRISMEDLLVHKDRKETGSSISIQSDYY